MRDKRAEILIIGAGAAGSMAALAAIEQGAHVTMLSRDHPYRATTATRHSGIAAALDLHGEGDSPALHAQETIVGGDFLADQSMVARMTDAAPAIAGLMQRMGIVFDRTAEGGISLLAGTGFSKARTLRAGVTTGQEVARVLAGQLLRARHEERLAWYSGWELLSLLKDESGLVRGVVAANRRSLEVRLFSGDAVVLAAGGFAGLFADSSAPLDADGAALATCFQQGAHLSNPEFVQVHPFTILTRGKRRPVPEYLLAEGTRVFCWREGRPWYVLEERCAPLGARVPHDVALRALREAAREVGDERATIALDCSALDPMDLEQWLGSPQPEVVSDEEVVSAEAPLGVEPAIVRTLGGLTVDADHATTLSGLFAAGDCTAAYHGACALPANEILAALQGGLVAGRSAAAYADRSGAGLGDIPQSVRDAALAREEDRHAQIYAREGDENIRGIRRDLHEAMRDAFQEGIDDAALVKTEERLEILRQRLDHAALADTAHWANPELFAARHLEAAFDLARATIAAARARQESRGVFFKPAHPKRDDANWLVTTKVSLANGQVQLDHSERIDTSIIEPTVRTYEGR